MFCTAWRRSLLYYICHSIKSHKYCMHLIRLSSVVRCRYGRIWSQEDIAEIMNNASTVIYNLENSCTYDTTSLESWQYDNESRRAPPARLSSALDHSPRRSPCSIYQILKSTYPTRHGTSLIRHEKLKMHNSWHCGGPPHSGPYKTGRDFNLVLYVLLRGREVDHT